MPAPGRYHRRQAVTIEEVRPLQCNNYYMFRYIFGRRDHERTGEETVEGVEARRVSSIGDRSTMNYGGDGEGHDCGSDACRGDDVNGIEA